MASAPRPWTDRNDEESRKRDTIFPGSNPGKQSTLLNNYRNPIPPIPPTSPRGSHVRDRGVSERGESTRQIRTSQPASKDVSNNHTIRRGLSASSTGPAKRPFADRPGLYPFESAQKDDKDVMASKRRTEQQTKTAPQVNYHEFMVLDQAGSAVMGFDDTRERNLVAIKRLNGIDKSSTRRLRPFTSDHVVNVREAYIDHDDLVIVYEQMDISLRHITGLLSSPFKPFQIAAICNELIAGLLFIHEQLSLHHGELSCGTILLNRDGMVKIANIGESFVQDRYVTAESRHEDVCSLGFVMMELMEPLTYILSPRSTELQNPEKWTYSIKNFLGATQHQSLEQLQKSDFLPLEPSSKCLKAHVFCGMFAAGAPWDNLSLP